MSLIQDEERAQNICSFTSLINSRCTTHGLGVRKRLDVPTICICYDTSVPLVQFYRDPKQAPNEHRVVQVDLVEPVEVFLVAIVYLYYGRRVLFGVGRGS
jgi:hypothetical protein